MLLWKIKAYERDRAKRQSRSEVQCLALWRTWRCLNGHTSRQSTLIYWPSGDSLYYDIAATESLLAFTGCVYEVMSSSSGFNISMVALQSHWVTRTSLCQCQWISGLTCNKQTTLPFGTDLADSCAMRPVQIVSHVDANWGDAGSHEKIGLSQLPGPLGPDFQKSLHLAASWWHPGRSVGLSAVFWLYKKFIILFPERPKNHSTSLDFFSRYHNLSWN